MPSGTISNNEAFIFDELILEASDHISYDSLTGTFLITNPGNYLISFWIAFSGADYTPIVGITVDSTNYSTITSPIGQGQFSGLSLITINNASIGSPVTLQLINHSGGDIVLADAPVQGNIVVFT